jgi:hypothetical protein
LAVQSPDEQMVAVPAHPGAGGQLILEARRTPEGLTLLVFSSVRVLVTALGQSQPWAILPLAKVAALAAAVSVKRVLLDPEISGEAWRWEPQDLGGFSWEVST